MEWISVEDRLPNHEQRILCVSDGYIDIKYFERKSGNPEYIFYDGDAHCYCPQGVLDGVTHWMPLPNIPEKK